MMVKTSSAMAAVDSTRPAISTGAASGFFDLGAETATRRAPTAATGPIAMKMLDQLKCSSSQPPTIGPSAIATPATAPHRPMARARSVRSGKNLVISDSVPGRILAAPSHIRTRTVIDYGVLVVERPPAV